MTATLAAMFIDEGKLRWDTTIAEVFPELKGKMNPYYETVTVEQLLRHRGGVPTDPPAAAWTRAWLQVGTPVEQRREFIAAVLAAPPADKTGTNKIYSNQGYAIVGAMLEKIAGQPWETLITDKLFKPLHMDTAGFGAPGTPGKTDQPWGHLRRLLMTVPIQNDNPPAIAPAGRVHCSLDDLARYAIFHLEGEKKDGLLKAETVRRLHTPPADGDYACGWVVMERSWAGGKALWHNGSNTYWYVNVWLAPVKDFAVIVATNIDVSDANDGTDAVAVAMINKWLGN
jgi:CubicO group peptidase (beta-lactamase class C family)